jgi:hypothetical protein
LKIYRSKEKNIVAAKMQDEAVLLKPQAVAGVVRRRDYFVLR